MSFEHPWALVLVILPPVWLAWEWRRVGNRAGLALKALAGMLALLALAGPRMGVWETKMAVAVLVDTSASVTEEDLEAGSKLASEIQRRRGRHWAGVMPFARGIRRPGATEQPGDWELRHTAGEQGRLTNLEAAIRDALAALPAGMVPRIALISDGNENRGTIARAAWQASQLGVPVDTFLLQGRPEPRLRLESVSLPTQAFAGERFPVDLLVRSPSATDAEVEISAEGRTLGSETVRLGEGVSEVRVYASLKASGAFDLSGSIRAGDLGEVRFAQALTLREPRMLYVTQDPPGTEQHLLGALRAAAFEIEQATELDTARLAGYQVVILNNWDLEGIPEAGQRRIEEYVQQGGGLLVIGGERNVYLEERTEESALERTLPAKLAPPRSPEGTCVVLIVDKSSSMEGKKMQLARMAAIGVIENLRAVDRIGVLIFDNSHQWAVPIRKAEDRTLIKRLVAGITPDGGTQIAPALAEAYRRALPVRATFKHIVLLTDGISEEGDSIQLAQEAASRKVTISTVGLGQDVNKQYLEKVALYAKGKSYILSDPSTLAQILLRDVMEHTGSTTIEKPITPVVLLETEILEGVGLETAPPLKGYVRYEAKTTAETILQVEEKDPLLAQWQYGLGRATVFTSDAKSRWAADWVGWEGYDRFWINLARDLLPHAAASEATVRHDSASGELVADYRLSERVPEPEVIPDLFVLGPGGFRKTLAVRKLAAGAYEGRAVIDDSPGLFRIRPLTESMAFPEVGFYRQQQELSEWGSNEALLRSVSEFTGGRFGPEPGNVFDSGGRAVASTMDLWPGLLLLALLVNLGEVVLRKWRGIAEFVRGRG
ncbi:MAG: VWA domain-containing protein [bacterium]|nr:VWA domain-containing protein [bacterium]